MELEKLHDGLKNGVRVAIHLGFDSLMSDRELGSLASQVRRAYGANRTSCDGAIGLWLVGLEEGGRTYRVFREKNDGFDDYVVGLRRNFDPDWRLVYLSPDAGRPLEAPLDPSVTYVIGGISDGTVAGGTTLGFAESRGVECRRLPIREHCRRAKEGGTFSQVMTVNSVFEVLLRLATSHEGKDWAGALEGALPPRTGWTVRKQGSEGD